MKSSVKTATLIIGTMLGALLGYRVALTFLEESDNDSKSLPITASQGLQVGMTALGMLKQISGISKNKI